MRYAKDVLKRISCNSKEDLSNVMQKGQNEKGGVFGGNSPDREPCSMRHSKGMERQGSLTKY